MILLMDETAGGYRPGACNIGPAEIERRRRSTIAAFVASIALGALLVAVGAPPAARAIVFLPMAGGFVSWLQVRRRFCVAFGLLGVLNFGALGSVDQVAGTDDRSADRRTALRMILEGSAAAALMTIGFLLLPA
jgi:hypothetical protein